jgi:hypothetical protein
MAVSALAFSLSKDPLLEFMILHWIPKKLHPREPNFWVWVDYYIPFFVVLFIYELLYYN